MELLNFPVLSADFLMCGFGYESATVGPEIRRFENVCSTNVQIPPV